jgi:hypothetical protein
MLLFALFVSPLFGSSVHLMGSVLIRAKGAAIFVAVSALWGWTKFATCALAFFLDPKRYLGRDQPWPSATLLGSPSRCSAIFTSSLLV